MSPAINDDFFEMIKLAILHTKFEMVMPRNATRKELIGLTAPAYVMAEQFDCLFPGNGVLKRVESIFPDLTK